MKKILLCTVLSFFAFNAVADEAKHNDDFISRAEVKNEIEEVKNDAKVENKTELKTEEKVGNIKSLDTPKNIMIEKTIEIKVENKVDEKITEEKVVKVKTNEVVADDEIIETKEVVEKTDVKKDGKLVAQEIEIKDRQQNITKVKKETAEIVKQELKDDYSNLKNNISRFQFTSQIKDREPTDKLEVAFFDKQGESIVFFNEIVDFKDGIINHTWYNGEKEIYSRDFKITSDRYRFSTSVRKEHFKKGDSALVVIKNAKTGKEIVRSLIELR